MIQAKVVGDSKNEFGNRITTMIVTFPRIILAELNTHRMLSRNSASSRAIPFVKMVEQIKTNPFIPIAWMKDHKGMQGNEYLNERDVEVCKSAYIVGRDMAVRQAEHLSERGLTKQIVNRGLEPYMWHTAIITATEWENFFALRCPQYVTGLKLGSPEESNKKIHRSWKDLVKYYMNDLKANRNVIEELENNSILDKLKANSGQAEIHMMALAEVMWDAYNESNPKLLKGGEWHIPNEETINELYGISQKEIDPKDNIPIGVKIGTMLSARTSYTVLNTEMSVWNIDKHIEMCDGLAKAKPIHASPFEHCSITMNKDQYYEHIHGDQFFQARENNLGESILHTTLTMDDKRIGWSGNFRGFIQYRKMIPGENITK